MDSKAEDDAKKGWQRNPDYRGGFSPEAEEMMFRRSQAFARATQRKGMPMVYGAGKEKLNIPPPPWREG